MTGDIDLRFTPAGDDPPRENRHQTITIEDIDAAIASREQKGTGRPTPMTHPPDRFEHQERIRRAVEKQRASISREVQIRLWEQSLTYRLLRRFEWVRRHPKRFADIHEWTCIAIFLAVVMAIIAVSWGTVVREMIR